MKRLAVILSALLAMIGCNQGQEQAPNPFFEQWTTPYGVPPFESIKNYHYQPAFERAMSLHLEEIEAIVYSGTRLNINYFIEEVVDPDEEEEIYDYFKTAENDNIQTAMEVLGYDDYDELHVRLVRIKFQSELGN